MAQTTQKIRTLYKRLERVNTELNALEDAWPCRKPTDARVKPLKFSVEPKRLPKKAVASIQHHAQRLADALPGWEVSVDVYAFTGQDAGCVINVFTNGQAPGRCGCQVYNSDLKSKSTSWTPALNACAEQWPAEVDRLIAKFKGFDLAPFQTERYKRLCDLRGKLNQQWEKLCNWENPYPYGKHGADWPEG